MRKVLVQSAAVLAALFAIACPAHAIPIWFEFSGTAANGGNEPSPYLGQSFTARLTIETEGFVFTERNPGQPWFDLHQDISPTTRPSLFTLDLTIGGVHKPFDLPFTNAAVMFLDDCDVECGLYESENWQLGLVNRDVSNAEANAPTRSYNLNHFTFYGYDANTSNFLSRADVFEIESILRLPVSGRFGAFLETTEVCVDGVCEYPRFIATNLDIDSVSRGVGAYSVPEPGTLGLLAFGAFGALGARRKRMEIRA